METIMEVEVEEDCTSTVTRIPIMRPTIGFCMYSFCSTDPAGGGGGGGGRCYEWQVFWTDSPNKQTPKNLGRRIT